MHVCTEWQKYLVVPQLPPLPDADGVAATDTPGFSRSLIVLKTLPWQACLRATGDMMHLCHELPLRWALLLCDAYTVVYRLSSRIHELPG
jgi:hypothetical protein